MNLIKFLIPAFFSAGIFCCLIFPVQAAEIIWHGTETITSPTVWRDGEIHAISDGAVFDVMPGASLTLEAGTIVKVGFNSVIRIYGDFRSQGLPDQFVYIVSLRDDSVGGDTNGDGLATVINNGDWRGLQFDGNRYKSKVDVEMEYTVVSHGGGSHGGGQIARGLTFFVDSVNSMTISDCQLVNNKGAIFSSAQAKNIIINNSNIYNENCDYHHSTDGCQYDLSYRSFSTDSVDITGNYWGSPLGPTYTTGSDPEYFNGVVVANLMGNVSYLPYTDKPFDFFNTEKKLNPVLVIPGIMGSWQDYSGKWKIDPILHTYDDLLEALRLAGYQDNETLFTFPYQWRYSNELSAVYLKNKIDQVKSQCQGEEFDCSKVDLVAHSMGGLIARQYIAGEYYENDIDQLIFIATPHRGAPKSYLMWEGGEIGDGLNERVLKTLVNLEAKKNGYWGKGALARYLKDRDYTSVKELLPIYSYLFDKEDNFSTLRYYPDNHPRNEFLENLNSQSALQSLAEVKLLNIIADNEGLDTLIALELITSTEPELWSHGMPDNFYGYFGDRGLIYGSGDQTVPELSNNTFLGLDPVIFNSDHGRVVTEAQKEIIKELTGVEPEAEVRGLSFPNLLLIMMHSPADLVIIDPLGRQLGRDFYDSNGTGVLEEIPEAFYSGFSEVARPEFIIIPNPIEGEYLIKTLGNDTGDYSVTVDYFTETETSGLEFHGLTYPGRERQLSFNFNKQSGSFSEESFKTDIDVDSALEDVDFLFNSGLLQGRTAWLTLRAKYGNLKIKVDVKNSIINSLNSEIAKLSEKNWPESIKQRYQKTYESRIVVINQQRQDLINSGIEDINRYTEQLLALGSLDQSGHDIIKTNNDYLLLNW
jgi:pimeloyl-ACP methyl ester carboxylesterase